MAQDEQDGLLPPVALDRSDSIGAIRRAIAVRKMMAAREEAEKLCLRAPRDAEALFWAGYVALAQGRDYDAIRILRRAEALDPNPFVLKVLAASYYRAHQPRLFLIKVRAAQQKQPEDFASYYFLGRYFDSDVADFSQAIDYFKQALARRPDHFRSHYYLGHSYEAEGKTEQAEAEYRRGLQLAGRQGENDAGLPDQGLARLRLASNRPGEALEFAKHAVALSPRDAAGHKLLARTYWALSRTAEAVAQWEISTELDSTDASTWYRLYRGYLSLGEAEKARQAMKRFKEIAALYGTN